MKEIKELLWYQIAIDTNKWLKDFLHSINSRWFDIYKLEKDFWLTVILHYIALELPMLRFKWGTCLNKVYYPYFRLSEDLDFTIPIDDSLVDTNSKRDSFARMMREKIKYLCKILWWSLNDDTLHHKKAQWNKELSKKAKTYLKYVITYQSTIDKSQQTIKVELTYSLKQYFPSKTLPILSCFLDPILESDVFPSQTIQCLDIEEMITEKCRAAMTRRTPAIRDYFDLWYLHEQWIPIDKHITIIIDKCKEVSNLERTLIDKYSLLQQQENNDLKPMLEKVYDFDLDMIYHKLLSLQQTIKWYFTTS